MTVSPSSHTFTRDELIEHVDDLRRIVLPSGNEPPMGERCASIELSPVDGVEKVAEQDLAEVLQSLVDIATCALDAAPADARFTIPSPKP